MGFYVLVEPGDRAAVQFCEFGPGQPALTVDSDGSRIAVHPVAGQNGLLWAAKFARDLAYSATQFASRLEELARESAPPPDGRGRHAGSPERRQARDRYV